VRAAGRRRLARAIAAAAGIPGARPGRPHGVAPDAAGIPGVRPGRPHGVAPTPASRLRWGM